MHVNTSVVKALMYLRGVSESDLANLIHVTLADLQAWLYDQSDDSEERVPFETQLEVLKLLGIAGEAPRSDVVHYWRIHESLFSRPATTYWALHVVLKAFGKAQAVFISREADPVWTWTAKAHFGLRFEGFMAILEVTAHPLRSISLDPSNMADLTWVPETFGVLLPDAEYDRLEPGAMKVRGLTQYLTYTTERTQWERLREAALENGIRAEQVASLMLGQDGAPIRLTNEAPAPVVEHNEKPAEVKPEPAEADTARLRTMSAPAQTEDMHLFVTPVRTVERSGQKRGS